MADTESLFVTLACYVVYFLAVDFAYRYFMLDVWRYDFLETSWGQYEGMQYAWPASFCLFLVSAFFVSRIGDRPSDFLHVIFFTTPIVPMLVLTAHKGIGFSFVVVSLVAFWVSYCVSLTKIEFVAIRAKKCFLNADRYLMLCILLGIGILLWMIVNGGLSYINFRFDQVYEFRRGASQTRGTLLNYLLLNYVGVLLGLGFAIAYSKKRLAPLCVLLAVNVLIYAFTSNKAYLFVGLFVLAIYIIRGRKRPAALYAMLLASICVGLTLIYLVFPSQWVWGTLFVRRYVFVPAYANFLYWEFFSEFPFALWTDSKVGLGLVPSVYGRPTPQVISDHFTGVDFSNTVQLYSNANTGWLGSGYGNGGFVGVLIYAVLSGVITKFANKLGQVLGERVAVAAVSFYFFAIFFTSTDLPAALLTYGFFSLVVVTFFWRGDVQQGGFASTPEHESVVHQRSAA